METISIILIILGIFLLFSGGLIATIYEKPWLYLLSLLGMVMIITAIIIEDQITPDERDVLQGRAIYQETIHITGNDTVKTYEIVWKQND